MSRKTVTNFAIVACSVAFGLYLSRGPWVAYQQQKKKADVATKEMIKAEQEKTDLQREKAEAESPMGRERSARDNGYLRKGEIPLNQDHANNASSDSAATH